MELKANEESANDIVDEDVDVLGHILISRFSGMKAVLPEAKILRHIDAIIQDVDGMQEVLATVEPGSIVTDQYNRRLYKKEVREEQEEVIEDGQSVQ